MLRTLLFLLISPALAVAQSATMVESFAAGQKSRTELKLELTGEVSPTGQANKRIEIQGHSNLVYDERVLASDDGTKLLRVYRDVDFQRTINGERQSQAIRSSVRRMVVMRSADGKKAPFSPDGPLTFGEIDAVRVDLFAPVLVAGLLPKKAVSPGDDWTVSADAVRDLTGLDSIESGQLTVKYVAAVTLSGQLKHRLSLTGVVSGQSEDGPAKQTIDATAYFDPKLAMLSYLSLKGIQELLDEKGKVVGRLTGRFTLQRSSSESDSIADRVLTNLEIRPTAENSLLLFDNPDLGLRFVYPRHWRVGAVQGKQVTIETTKAGAGMLVTVEPTDKFPTAEQFRDEAKQFITTQKGKVNGGSKIERVGDWDRFSLDVDLDRANLRMEYGLKKDRDHGFTIAARLPTATAKELLPDVERILKGIESSR